ncbi:MAG TPA: triose-phosphate isomerase family protein [Candidatus Saccharimonadales bacterium]|nr:triose-phosphate isomerase family protein [Candidatus Saccharimonadales bacterium]
MSNLTPFLVANFKANKKTGDEISNWIDTVNEKVEDFRGTVIIAPPYTNLAQTDWKLKSINSKIKLSSQDLSKFEQGAYTGEVTASLLSDLCAYSIIGHSERRQNFNETDEVLETKVQMATSAKIQPIFCIQAVDTLIPKGVNVVAYEPIFAIGTGNPDTPQNAKEIAKKVKEKGEYTILYGGSVTAENVKSFLEENVIDGVLVGGASQNPQSFATIIEAAK